MRHLKQALVSTVLATIPAMVLAAVPTITDNEEHVFRGFFDRQSGAIAMHRSALEKGSADVKTFAQQELDMIGKFGTDLAKLGDKFGLVTRGMVAGESSPKLGQGMTRGFETLPEGATWFSKGQFSNPLASNTMGGAGAAGMAAGAPAGAPPAGAAPQGAAPAGAAPGAAGMAAGGAAQNRYDYDAADLAKLSGKDFDRAYLLRTAIAHNAMLRHASNSINEAGANAELVEFSKGVLKTIAQQNQKIESLLSGQGLNSGPGARPAGAAPQGAPQGGAPAPAQPR